MSYETKALNKIATALGGSSRVQKNEILNEIAGNVDSLAGVTIYICGNGEYDTETGLPTVTDKDEKTIYLVPTDEESPNMYNEYIWRNPKEVEWTAVFDNPETSLSVANNGDFLLHMYAQIAIPFTKGLKCRTTINDVLLSEKDLNLWYSSRLVSYPDGGTPSFGDVDFSYQGGPVVALYYISGHGEDFGITQTSGDITIPLKIEVQTAGTAGFWELFGSSSGGMKNLVDGGEVGSIRSIGSNTESSSYTMGVHAVSIGYKTKATATYSYAEGDRTTSSGNASHTEGSNTTASGTASHAEGQNSSASKMASHAEGSSSTASGFYSHSEGENATASGQASHAEGKSTTASGNNSHAEGWKTKATSNQAHAEGTSTTASGVNSHAEGEITIAYGLRSHAEGYGTAAYGANQHVFGKCNLVDSNGEYVEIVGNGTGESVKSNARTLDWDGNEQLAGSLTLGLGTADKVTITAAQLKQLLATLS